MVNPLLSTDTLSEAVLKAVFLEPLAAAQLSDYGTTLVSVYHSKKHRNLLALSGMRF